MGRLRRMTKALLASYVITGLFLIILAFVLYKLEPPSGVIRVGIIFSYIFSPFIGGMIMGKGEKARRFLWGLLLGIAYFIIIFIISLLLNKNVFGEAGTMVTVLSMCMLGGMLGGMIS